MIKWPQNSKRQQIAKEQAKQNGRMSAKRDTKYKCDVRH